VRRRGEPEFRTFSEVFGTRSPSKFADVELLVGDEVLLESAGGGGYGDPRERDPALVARDVEQGLVSAAAAERAYGGVPLPT
jgi:N-methylhydantoinase B/oxoprolinase/acetone carboxylase alpha subunit